MTRQLKLSLSEDKLSRPVQLQLPFGPPFHNRQ